MSYKTVICLFACLLQWSEVVFLQWCEVVFLQWCEILFYSVVELFYGGTKLCFTIKRCRVLQWS